MGAGERQPVISVGSLVRRYLETAIASSPYPSATAFEPAAGLASACSSPRCGSTADPIRRGAGWMCRHCHAPWAGVSTLLSGRTRRTASGGMELRLFRRAMLAAPLRGLARDELRALLAFECLEELGISR